MAVKKIRKIGDPVLREKSRAVDTIDKNILKLVKDMVDTVSDGGISGIGLAAPQIGVLKRIIIVYLNEKFEAFINPEIKILDNEMLEDEEGCLSLYSVKTTVKRPKKIKLSAKNLKGDEIELEAEEMLARIFMHEIDHLNGMLFIDLLSPKARKDFLSKINREIKL
ncbi:MAG: peptide deformylase [Actinobacteria bacterium]|nr:peptide deformylase [Actinomycetota bacterium]